MKAQTTTVKGATTVAEVSVQFTRSSKDLDYALDLAASELPWDDAEFVRNLIKGAYNTVVYRSKEGIAVLPALGGPVTADMFIKGIKALTFRGDEKPNKDDEAYAKTVMNSITSGLFTAEQAVEKIQADYGWIVTPDEDGFKQHAMKRRLKEAAERAKGFDLSAL